MSRFDLANKAAIATGGAEGIGAGWVATQGTSAPAKFFPGKSQTLL